MPVDGFWEQVRTTRAWLDSSPTASEWTAEIQTWSGINEVSLQGGQVIKVDTSEIVRLMSIDPPDTGKLKAYFMALDAARGQWSQVDCGDCQASLLTAILAQPEFSQAEQPADQVQQFIQNLLDSIFNWLNKLLGGSGGIFNIPPVAFIIIISVLLAAILGLVFRDVFGSLADDFELADGGAGEILDLTASLASQKAMQLSGSGDYRSAMRYLYLSALLLLDERGLLRYNRSLTNREYLRQVSGQPELENNLKVIVDEFDRVWYGLQPIDQEEYARYAAQVAALEAIKP